MISKGINGFVLGSAACLGLCKGLCDCCIDIPSLMDNTIVKLVFTGIINNDITEDILAAHFRGLFSTYLNQEFTFREERINTYRI